MTSKVNFIHNIYSDFRDEWTEKNYPNLFENMRKIVKDAPHNYPHQLGHYAIFYTPVPKLDVRYMIIGNNPSWFHRKAKKDKTHALSALSVVQGLEYSPPPKNLYTDGEYTFSDHLKTIFRDCPGVLSSAVGLNRFWIQTGSGFGEFKKEINYPEIQKEFKKIQKYCEERTVQIVKELNPEVLFLFGKPAQDTFAERRINSEIINVRHPSNGGLSSAIKTIQKHRCQIV